MAHILLADDDFEDRFIMAETFKDLGQSDVISFVEDGQLVMDFLQKNSKSEISLIVLDLNMPRLNGTETLRLLKKSDYAEIPVIIFSTSVNEVEKEQCMKLGAHNYITKPSNYRNYVATCEMFLSMISTV